MPVMRRGIRSVPMGSRNAAYSSAMRSRRSGAVTRARSATARQALRTGGWANPSSGAELKFVDNSVTGALLPSTMTVAQLLNGLAPGSTASTRIGRKVIMRSLLFKYRYSLQPTTTQGGKVRIMLVYDKQANAAAPVATDILLSTNFTSQNNLSNRDRFVVLCDHISEPISVNGNWTGTGEVYKRFSLETMFNAGTAGTIGDITSGSVYLVYGTTSTFGVAAPSIDWDSRVRYVDN